MKKISLEYFQILFLLMRIKNLLIRVFLLYVIIEKTINAHLGQFKLQKCYTTIKKTIYYDNAVIKVYDIPILYIPKLVNPDPTVKRESGFLTPSFSDTKNLGSNISVPYFWAINHDKNFKITNNFYASENPLFLGEYHQILKF